MASSSCPPSLLLRSHFPPAEAAAPDLQTPPAATAAAAAVAVAVGLKVKVTRVASTVMKIALKPSQSQQAGILEQLETKTSLAGGIAFLFSILFGSLFGICWLLLLLLLVCTFSKASPGIALSCCQANWRETAVMSCNPVELD